MARQLKRRRVCEDGVLTDFEASRRSVVQLVADSNLLLSAGIGGRAALVLRHERGEQVFTPAAGHDEVFGCFAPLAKKEAPASGHAPADAGSSSGQRCGAFRVRTPPARAERRVGKRDSDDVDGLVRSLALALGLNLPVWSSDNDFEDAGGEWHTAAGLLKPFRIGSV